MNRRTYLAAVAAPAGATVLGGCSGGDPGGTEPQPGNGDGEDPEVAEARTHYETAIDALIENEEIFGDWADGRPGRDQSDIDELRANLERARGSLAEAEALAPTALGDRLEQARGVADFHGPLADYYEVTIEFEEAEADAAAYGDTEQHERAVEQYREAESILESARAQLGDVEAAHDRVDTDAIEAPDLAYPGRYTQYVDVDGPASIDAQALLIEGKREVHRMFVELNAGFDHYENEAFVAARERLTAGDEARQAAAAAFTAVQDHDAAWRSLREESIQLQGIVEDLAEAFELFIDATHEAEDGNHEAANELAEEGFFVIDQAFA